MSSVPLAPPGAARSPIDAQAPIGVFDSGVGGLSVLCHIRDSLPREHLVYVADTAHAPYGGLAEAAIAARALAIGAVLQQRGVKALVVACNTATAVAIAALRTHYPSLLVIGVEPGLKPAAAQSRTGIVGVLATAATLGSSRFAALQNSVAAATGVRFLAQPCPGLADCIERGELPAPGMLALLEDFVAPLLEGGADTLVLGCTHYPFALPLIETVLVNRNRTDVSCIDTGAAVARQLARMLAEHGLLRPSVDGVAGQHATGNAHRAAPATVTGLSSGPPADLEQAFARLLNWRVAVTPLGYD
ncbi:MAG: glutamate racemase [Herminiimonas sp.]|nr:glutamate racemase [Herminiimonas sp.]